MHEALDIKNYLSEATGRTANSAILGKTIADLFNLAKGGVAVTSITARQRAARAACPTRRSRQGDTPPSSKAITRPSMRWSPRRGSASPATARCPKATASTPSRRSIGAGSSLIGWSAQSLGPVRPASHVNLLAISRKGQRFTERPGTIPLELGDIIIVQGDRADTAGTAARPRLPAARRAADPPRQRPARPRPGPGPGGRGGGDSTGMVPVAVAILRRRVRDGAVRRRPVREAYTVARRADPRHARRAHPGQRSRSSGPAPPTS